MRVIMVKKRLENGEPCRKCAQTEEMLRRRGLWDRVDEVVWAIEGEPGSPGMKLAAEHDARRAPFFVVEQPGAPAAVYESALKLIKERLSAPQTSPANADYDGSEEPTDVLRWGLEQFGVDLAIAFSGAEDVALIDMAADAGLPFSVFCLDTGRLHPETYDFIDRVRAHYGIEIALFSPDPALLEPFVRQKGLFSFYEDGHSECCGIRKVEPLGRALSGFRAWATGQRRDQSPETRGKVAVVETDTGHTGSDGAPLVKLNPLAAWSSTRVWDYIRDRGVPYNALHERGFRSIGCAPCTRPVLPGQHERDGRWWWERADAKECGLHIGDAGDD